MTDFAPETTIYDGGKLFKGTYTTTNPIRSKVVDNRAARREKITFLCLSTQAGTLVISDIDEDGDTTQIVSQAVVANTLLIYSHNHVCLAAVCDFTPSAAPGTEHLTIRAYAAGWGARS